MLGSSFDWMSLYVCVVLFLFFAVGRKEKDEKFLCFLVVETEYVVQSNFLERPAYILVLLDMDRIVVEGVPQER